MRAYLRRLPRATPTHDVRPKHVVKPHHNYWAASIPLMLGWLKPLPSKLAMRTRGDLEERRIIPVSS